MLRKPPLWNVSPALIDPRARSLWRGVAFVAPLFQGAHLGGNILLGPGGVPLRGVPLTADTGTEMRVTPYGLGVGSAPGSNILYRDNYEPIVTSDGAGTGDFTMMILCNPFAENRISWGLAQGNTDNNTNHWLGFNNAAGSLSTTSSGTFTFSTRLVNGITASSAASVIDGKYHLYAGRRQGTNVDTIVDGIVRGTTSGTVRDITTGALGFSIGHRPESANSLRLDSTVSVVIAAAWNRALSDAELRLLARDPFIMIRPFRRSVSGAVVNLLTIAAVSGTTVVLQKTAQKVVSVTASALAAIQKGVQKTLVFAGSSAASLVSQAVKTVGISAVSGTSLTLQKNVQKSLVFIQGSLATLSRVVQKRVAAQAASTLTILKGTPKNIAVSVTNAASVATQKLTLFVQNITLGVGSLASVVANLVPFDPDAVKELYVRTIISLNRMMKKGK